MNQAMLQSSSTSSFVACELRRDACSQLMNSAASQLHTCYTRTIRIPLIIIVPGYCVISGTCGQSIKMLRSNGRRLLSNLQSLVSRRDKLVNHRKLLSITSSSRMATSSTTDDKEQSETDLRSVLVSTVLDLETLDPYLFR